MTTAVVPGWTAPRKTVEETQNELNQLIAPLGAFCVEGSPFSMFVRPMVFVCLLSWCHAHLDADPDLDASTNRAFRDVRDVGPLRFS